MITQISTERLALVVTDPQNDFLSEQGVTWGVVGESVVKNNTVENIERLFAAAKQRGLPTFITPNYYPHDHKWRFEGALEALMLNAGHFALETHGPEVAAEVTGFLDRVLAS